MLSYDELSHAFYELHEDMISRYLKNIALNLKASSLSKDIETLKTKMNNKN